MYTYIHIHIYIYILYNIYISHIYIIYHIYIYISYIIYIYIYHITYIYMYGWWFGTFFHILEMTSSQLTFTHSMAPWHPLRTPFAPPVGVNPDPPRRRVRASHGEARAKHGSLRAPGDPVVDSHCTMVTMVDPFKILGIYYIQIYIYSHIYTSIYSYIYIYSHKTTWNHMKSLFCQC